jgi:outer membrane protein assembly factor BamB
MKTLLVVILLLLLSSHTLAEDWSRFRGPNGSGVSNSKAPVEWTLDKNLKWSAELPGKGSSSPIVFGNRVYLTCYTGFGLDKANPGNPDDLVRHLIAFDRDSGEEIWRSSVKSENDEDPYKGFIVEHGYASSTPVTDGEHIFVLMGKTGMVAFDLEGNQIWKTHLGNFSDPARWGGGSGAAIYGDLVIVNAGIVGHSIAALNKSDGTIAWSIKDATFTNCWSTPILVNVDGRTEMVFSMPGKILAVNPETGERLWNAKSPINQTVCGSLCEKDGVVFAMGGRAGDAVAIRCGGSGDVSKTHTLWTGKLRSGIGTPIIVGGNMYWSSGGIAYAASCETGQYVYKERLPRKESPRPGARRMPAGDYASPVAIGEHIMMLTRNGNLYVVSAGEEFKLAAQNVLDGDESLFNATPAISDGKLFIRSETRLYCIASKDDQAAP